jgi:hypothetical protein
MNDFNVWGILVSEFWDGKPGLPSPSQLETTLKAGKDELTLAIFQLKQFLF